jgi:DNA-binding transcriptional regulator YdaS (Cro superfamily)
VRLHIASLKFQLDINFRQAEIWQMLLSDWLKNKGRGARVELARRIGVSPQHITGLCDGSSWPSRAVARAIERETDGAVTADDFVHLDPEAA